MYNCIYITRLSDPEAIVFLTPYMDFEMTPTLYKLLYVYFNKTIIWLLNTVLEHLCPFKKLMFVVLAGYLLRGVLCRCACTASSAPAMICVVVGLRSCTGQLATQ